MTVQCPSCGVTLRVKEDRLGGRSSARCPRCHGAVPLAAPATATATSAATIRVSCAACGVRLKAPASRAGARSRCPRCRAEVVVPAAAPLAAQPKTPFDDISGAATRRIDSRTLGVAGTQASGPPVEGVDLEAFLKGAAPAPASGAGASGAAEESAPPGPAVSLVRPPVGELRKIAGDIREAARGFDPSSSATPPRTPPALPAGVLEAEASAEVGRVSRARDHVRPAEAPEPRLQAPPPSLQAIPQRRAKPFPALRGVASGGAAGLIVGGAYAAALTYAATIVESLVPPLPLRGETLGVPDMAVRVALLALLGAMAGFIAAALGSPSVHDRPLSLVRCGSFSLLAGLACGLVSALTEGVGVQIWPIANWMRDLLLVGILAPPLHRLLPSPRG